MRSIIIITPFQNNKKLFQRLFEDNKNNIKINTKYSFAFIQTFY